jgi:hypothetical protein
LRIGPITSLSLQTFKHSSQRDFVAKHIPGYLLVHQYDVKSRENLITVEGTLVGSSSSNLALQISQLVAIYEEQQPVWIDASDQYQAYMDFCRITKLDGPNVDSTKSPLIANFTITAESLLPWGTTHTNPWNQPGIVFRDLDGRPLGNSVNPLKANCNFTSSNPGGSMANGWFSWEFILDNQAPFSNAISVQEANVSTGTIVTGAIGGSAFSSSGADSTESIQANGQASMKGTVTSPSASKSPGYDIAFDLGASGINLSSYDRLRMWFRCDQTSNLTYYFKIGDVSGNLRWWNFTPTVNTWTNLLLNISVYTSQSSTAPNFSQIRYFGIDVDTGTSPPSSFDIWFDDLRLEIGYVNHCEDTSIWTAAYNPVTLANDGRVFKNSYYGIGAQSLPGGSTAETSLLSALKATATSTSSGMMGLDYFLPVSGWNVSSYDFLLFWIRSDFAGNSTGNVFVNLVNGASYFEYNFYTLNAYQWYRLVVPLRKYSGTVGTPSLSSINQIQILTQGANSLSTNLWLDEIAFDIGNIPILEMHLPDNVSLTANNRYAIVVSCWNGSSYSLLDEEDQTSYIVSGGSLYTLDGSYADQWSSHGTYGTIYPMAAISDSVVGSFGPNTNQSLTYTSTYGSYSRFAVALYIPPATSDSTTGNLPSDDLSGFQAFNKTRLKVQIYLANNEDTTYTT